MWILKVGYIGIENRRICMAQIANPRQRENRDCFEDVVQHGL